MADFFSAIGEHKTTINPTRGVISIETIIEVLNPITRCDPNLATP